MTENFDKIEKYSLSIYHFNLQYKAGDGKSYDALVRASFQPFLKFFEEFPQWKASLELQGHMIGYLARHFPEDLERLRILNNNNQIEIVNVHYSDQVYLAYPYRDMQESSKLNTEIFKRYGLKRSKVFFAQENFFGEGTEKYMREHGYEIGLLNQHFYRHHHEIPFAPYYRYKSINALIKGTHGYEAEDGSLKIIQNFSYWDDGELAFATGNNYMPGYGASEKNYQKHVNKYKKLERDGYKIVGVEDYINRVKELNLKPVELDAITDGSWNMRYYGGVYLWMGTYRLPWERDGEIRSYTYRVRSYLLATEAVIKWCKSKGIDISNEIKLDLKMAWKHLLLAEVSDSTGQTPVLIEVYYTPKEAKDCVMYCKKILDNLNIACNSKNIEFPWDKYIDTSDGKSEKVLINDQPLFYGEEKNPGFISLNDKFEYISYKELMELIGGTIHLLRIRKRSVKFTQYKVPLPDEIKDGKHIIFDITWHPNYTKFVSRIMSFFREQKNAHFTELYDKQIGCYSGLIFPLNTNKLIYCPALMENEPRIYGLDEFDFKRTWLPLPNGLIGLGNDVYVIKHNYYGDTHIAATLNSDNQFLPDSNSISFMTLNPPRKTYNWRFSIYKGSIENAVKLANRINVNPIVKLNSEPKYE